ncbi:CIC11C00000000152 [Sungouiella intermedia]|uniref:CIC11C00000000152 n=1 Tax=Sungouiella intermedia TaxID=45354 RepID=A0A1L0D447_9ASCO|nr:CIC11C00000000152 [[Candida] intermedia]
MNNLDQVINLKVKITNLLDESIVATIYAFNPGQEVLVLKVSPSGGARNGPGSSKLEQYKIINTAFIKSLQVMPPFPKKGQKPYTGFNQRLAKVDISKLEADLNRAISQHRNHKVELQTTKKNETSPLAAKIFDKMSQKFGKENIHWHGNESILAFKEIVISRPYALNKISNFKKSQASKHMDEVRSALREIWLEVDNAKRGG